MKYLASVALSYARRYTSSYFERAPEPLDKDVVAPGATTVHADRDATALERFGEVLVGELRA
jgi:hypothetical protein